MSKPLPRGYGVAAEEPPTEKEWNCSVCGHPESEHNADGLTDDANALLNALREIGDVIGKNPNPAPAKIVAIENILDDVLSVCQAKNCDCRKFEE